MPVGPIPARRTADAIAKSASRRLRPNILGLDKSFFRYHRSRAPSPLSPTHHHHQQLRFRSDSSSAASSIASGGAHSSAAGETQTRLTHIDETGRPAMVDVSLKAPTTRTATASGRIFIPKIAYDLMTLLPPSTEHPGATDGPDAKFQETYSPKLEEAKAKARSKGDVLTVAQLAAIMGCKRTSDLIPLCHPLPLTNISVRLFPEFHPLRTGRHASVEDQTSGNEAGAISGQANLEDCLQSGPSHYSVMCQATVSCEGKTGVEMEALTAVSVGLLTVWDMLKAVAGKEMVIGEIVVERKEGGKSGDFVRTHTRL